ncbi:heat shock protein Hsp20 [Caldimicrobium thiodismutans]|jgi:HSP20 family protein|uniref:Heat shock protein Hsp20 n=1 Tax=Caldimicrobium thiodismutans TaxID=1653476 RepID=A0A0U5B1J4_9BACT|nr:Hsp20/alpha crystallin family protein [Caldimicrobium thiodismutans]BAU23945.1 heat shock protein Hsp20 [Caldimicrobium thiodismutans]
MAELTIWRPFQDLKKEMDRLWQEFFGKSYLPERWEVIEWAPAVDVSETDDEVIVKADLPGVKPEEIEINLVDNVLTIKGEKKREAEEKKENYYRVERYYGSFMRAIQLPSEVDVEKVKAQYKDGVLKVTLPKKPEAKKKLIKVEVEK